jgi:ABC-type nitrate/sulfonate/bicarbonate transport system substrate-binding protein
MRRPTRVLVLPLALLAVLVASACSSGTPKTSAGTSSSKSTSSASTGAASSSASIGASSTAPAQKLTDFPVATFSGEIYGLDQIAKANGYFAQHGLNAQFITPSAGGGAANTLFLAGSVKAWAGNPSVPFTDITKGADIKFAGALTDWIPFAIQVPASSSLAKMTNASFDQKMQALKGKKIGLTGVGALVYYDLLAALKVAGVPQSSVTIIGVGQPTNAIGQLGAGHIDAYVTYSNSDALIMAKKANTVEFAALTGSAAPSQIRFFSTWAFPVLSSFASAHPDLVTGYMAAEKQAYDWAKANEAAAAKIVSDTTYQGQNLAEVTEGLKKTFSVAEDPNFAYPKDSYEQEIAGLESLGQLPAGSTSNPKLAYSTTVLAAAQK